MALRSVLVLAGTRLGTAPSEKPTTIGSRVVVGHLAHLEGCTIEDDALVGSGSIVLHDAVVRSNGLVGARGGQQRRRGAGQGHGAGDPCEDAPRRRAGRHVHAGSGAVRLERWSVQGGVCWLCGPAYPARMPTTSWGLTFDCENAPAMARFWTMALGYVDKPPPEGWDTWEDWLRHFEVPEEEWDDGANLCDPDGVLPGVGFLKVPEPKTAKNRLHLDLHVSGGRHVEPTTRTERIEAMVDRLVGAGGAVQHRDASFGSLDHVVMTDPEGNEFCVV